MVATVSLSLEWAILMGLTTAMLTRAIGAAKSKG
jgi:hypothetical protein